MDQYSLRSLLLSIRNIHAPWVLAAPVCGLFDPTTADSQISRLFTLEFGPLRTKRREIQGSTPSIKGNYTVSVGHLVLVTRLTRTMEAVVDFEQLCGKQNETIVKGLCIAAHNVLETFRFQSPYGMRPHGNSKNGLN
jgi:hypothetical protein